MSKSVDETSLYAKDVKQEVQEVAQKVDKALAQMEAVKLNTEKHISDMSAQIMTVAASQPASGSRGEQTARKARPASEEIARLTTLLFCKAVKVTKTWRRGTRKSACCAI